MLFNVSLDDGYGPDKDGVVKSRVVFQGLPPVIEIEDGMAGAVRILALPVIVLILGPMFFCARQLVSPPPSNHAHLCTRQHRTNGARTQPRSAARWCGAALTLTTDPNPNPNPNPMRSCSSHSPKTSSESISIRASGSSPTTTGSSRTPGGGGSSRPRTRCTTTT